MLILVEEGHPVTDHGFSNAFIDYVLEIADPVMGEEKDLNETSFFHV